MWYVYILQCVEGSLYTGYSNDLRQRFEDHQNGKGGHYTRSHKPSKIIYKEKLATKGQALKREYEIKKWSREKKMKLCRLTSAVSSPCSAEQNPPKQNVRIHPRHRRGFLRRRIKILNLRNNKMS